MLRGSPTPFNLKQNLLATGAIPGPFAVRNLLRGLESAHKTPMSACPKPNALGVDCVDCGEEEMEAEYNCMWCSDSFATYAALIEACQPARLRREEDVRRLRRLLHPPPAVQEPPVRWVVCVRALRTPALPRIAPASSTCSTSTAPTEGPQLCKQSPSRIAPCSPISALVSAALPTQPAAFAAANALNPYRMWTFRQSQCVAGSFAEDVAGAASLIMVRDLATTTCPPSHRQRHVIAFWLTTTSTTNADSLLLEVGPEIDTVIDCGKRRYEPQTSSKVFTSRIETRIFGGFTGLPNPVAATCPFAGFDDSGAIAISLSQFGGPFFIALTVVPGSATLLRWKGKHTLTTCTTTNVGLYNRFLSRHQWTPLSVWASANIVNALLADYHVLSFYDKQLTSTEANALFVAGLPNSVPVPNLAAQFFSVDEDLPNAANFSNLFAANRTVFDRDGNAVTALTVLSVPSPAAGVLKANNVALKAGDVINAGDAVTFHQAVPDAFSTSNPECVNPVASDAFANFTFKATDGLGDGSGSCPLASSCLSPVAGTVNLCVKETNDAPEVVGGAQTVIQLAESDRTSIAITCRDRDVTVGKFGLAGVRLLNQSHPSLGGVFVSPLRNCSSDGSAGSYDYDFGAPALIALNNSQPNEQVTLHLCYKARPTLLQQTLIGRDTIYYQCEDRAGLAAVSTVTMDIRSALLAGCGAEVLADKTNCRAYGREDYPIRVTLKGYDAVLAHNDASRKLYRLDSLPASGQLFHAGAVNLTYNVQLTDGYSYVNTSAALGANDTVPANLDTGFGDLVFIPSKNYFNGVCALNKDAPDTAITAAACPGANGAPVGSFLDGLGNPFHGCAANETAGCPLAFSFSLGYDEDGAGPAPAVFSPSLANGAEIVVFAVNDPLDSLAGPALLFFQFANVRNKVAFFAVPASNDSYRVADPDGDTYRVGFTLDPRQVAARANSGGAYLSDLNRLFDSLQVLTTLVSGNGSLVVSIWDPVTLPGDFNNANQIVESSERFTNALTTTLNFGTLSANQGVDTSLTAALWAGIAAAIFFVLMSCCACLGCIFRGARRGGRAATWVVRNVLCSEIRSDEAKKLELSNAAAGGRRSLEQAIHAEHARMARVMCCALFISRVFPCIKLKTEEALPDEEDMMKEALDGEAKRIALRHLPRQNYTATAIDLDGDGVVDVVVLDDPNDEMDSIFNWERHVDASNRVFYYNVKTNVSSWTPPTVKVDQGHVTTAHRQSLSRRNSGLELGLGLEPAPLAVVAATKLTPVPPSAPKPVPAPPPGTKFAPMPPAAPKTQKPADLADLAGGEEDRVKGG
ncbi:hypothetical protein BASA81_001069 [Batrachochytrium salamandrivorans]|nr:hypothetical protein BASA81_001069 [Batrachochytrium salamandrivorans]